MSEPVTPEHVQDLLEGFRKSVELSSLLLTLARQMAELAGSGQQLSEADLALYRTRLEQTEDALQQLQGFIESWPLLMEDSGIVH